MGGKGSGPKKQTKTGMAAKESMTKLCPKAVGIIGATLDKTNRDKLSYEAAIAVYEHTHGKAKIAIDSRVRGVVGVTADQRFLALMMAEEDNKLLGEGKDATEQEEG